jgi:hypothetical protein
VAPSASCVPVGTKALTFSVETMISSAVAPFFAETSALALPSIFNVRSICPGFFNTGTRLSYPSHTNILISPASETSVFSVVYVVCEPGVSSSTDTSETFFSIPAELY